MTFDREGLERWYREAMHRRLGELRGLRAGLRDGQAEALDAARAVAQALRSSGATFGFPHLSEVAALVESAPNSAVLRRVEGLIEHVRRLAAGEEWADALGAEWLTLAAGGDVEGRDVDAFPDLESAWTSVASKHGVDSGALAGRVAELFGLRVADLSSPTSAALHLVPEALMRSAGVLPLREDSETITVATADPASLDMEMQLTHLTGRSPTFEVSPPQALHAAMAGVLDEAPPPPRSVALAQAPAIPPGDGETERVLVVDDEPAARLLARAVLEKGGYEVEEAGDGEEALERLGAAQPVALIVADLNMPRIDGLELIWEMRSTADWSHIPVIVVTGETDEILETRLIEEGADDYIRKPLDPRLFLARVAATIRRAEH